MANKYELAPIDIDFDIVPFEENLTALEAQTKSFCTQVNGLFSSINPAKYLTSGIEMVGKAIDGAMNRSDVIDNFSRSMIQVSGSTEQVRQSIDALNNMTASTAFGIGEVTAATEGLVSSGLTLEDSTAQIKTWGDAVAFYGDGSSEQFNNVTNAIADMVSNGIVDMNSINQLYENGIPALEIYASATGQSTQDIQEALNSGKISAQEFTNGLTTAMREGTSSFSSIDGSAKTMSLNWSEAMDEMDESVDRGMSAVLDSINQVLIANDLPTIQKMFQNAGATIETVLGNIAANMPTIIDNLIKFAPLIAAIAAGIGTLVTMLYAAKTGTELWTAAQKTLDSIMKFTTLDFIVIGIVALVAGIITLWNTSEEFRTVMTELWNSLVEIFSPIIDVIIELFTVVIPAAFEIFKTCLDTLGEFIQTMWNFITGIIATFVNSIVEFFTVTIPGIWEGFKAYLSEFGEFIKSIFQNIWTNVVAFFTETIPAWISSAVEWFQSLASKIWNALLDAFSKIVKWGNDSYTNAISWISKTINDIIIWFQSLPGKIWNWLCEAVSKVVAFGTELWNKGTSAANELVTSIVETISSLPGKMLEIGENLVRGIWDGIVGMGDWIGNMIKGFCDDVVGGIKSFFGINSPSKLMRDMIGKYLPSGIAIGFEMAVPDASKDMNKSMQSMMGTVKKELDLNMNELSTGISLEHSAKVSNQSSIISQFPKTFSLKGKQTQPVYLVLNNGTELAHALVEPLNNELAFL